MEWALQCELRTTYKEQYSIAKSIQMRHKSPQEVTPQSHYRTYLLVSLIQTLSFFLDFKLCQETNSFERKNLLVQLLQS